jgi:hypothetical protein
MNTIEQRLQTLNSSLDGTRQTILAQEQDLLKLREDLRYFHERISTLSAAPKPNVPVQVGGWRLSVVYGLMAALGLGASLAVPWHRVIAEPSIKVARPALPEVPLIDPQSLADERANDELLGLVYAFTPAGAGRSVHELLSPEAQSAAGNSPWVFVDVDARTALVSFKPHGDDPDSSYEFVVNKQSRQVSAAPETLLNLQTLAAMSSL